MEANMAQDERTPRDAESLRRLAAEVSRLIAAEVERSEDSPLLEAYGAKCPPGQLCCRKGVKCGAMTFRCETGFRCMNNFAGLAADE